MASSLSTLGDFAMRRGNLGQASDNFRQALALFQQMGMRTQVVQTGASLLRMERELARQRG
uniref:Tetratricopeptide repeat-containing protein n=1 Tax=Candidatus Kentrum sp. FW TaxID=2126338 RepID=A0A450TZD6_9GAMM|nr:MAG: hypothetical protein BECKFW1821C_GA0114237_107118 [Candidatus Kentron sp. FW]